MVAHGRINTGLNMLGKSPSLSTFMHRCLLTVAASPSCSRKWHISLLVRAPARRSQKILNALLALHGEDCGFKLDTAALLFYSTGSSIFSSSSRNIHLLYFLSILELSTFVLRWLQDFQPVTSEVLFLPFLTSPKLPGMRRLHPPPRFSWLRFDSTSRPRFLFISCVSFKLPLNAFTLKAIHMH